MITIEAYNRARDEAGVLAVWEAALGQTWPLTPRVWQAMTEVCGPNERGPQFVALQDGVPIGVILTQRYAGASASAQNASITAMAVRPEMARRTVGSALLDAALNELRTQGVGRVQVGGRLPRLWPGVPLNLPSAVGFFTKHGFNPDTWVCDLTQDLTHFAAPAGFWEKFGADGLTIAPAQNMDEAGEALAFEASNFPNWYDEYAYPISKGDYGDVLIARDPAKGIVGTLILYSALHSFPARIDAPWTRLYGEDCGALNAVGVAESERGRNIGLGLVLRGSEVLKARGVRVAHIGWTEKSAFYEKAGYQVWREFKVGYRKL